MLLCEIFFSNWDLESVDYVELLGGLITRWNKSMSLLNTFVVSSSLCTKFLVQSLGCLVMLLNIYGPYNNKQEFLERLLHS